MADLIEVTGRNQYVGVVNDVVLDEQRDLRLVFRPNLVVHNDAPDAKLNGRLVRQKRHKRGTPWQDIDSFDVKTMKMGEEVQMDLDADTLIKFYEELKKLYGLPLNWSVGSTKEYVVLEKDSYYVATGREKELLEELVKREGTNVWDLLDELGPGMVEAVALRKQHASRQKAVEEFEQHMRDGDWNEIKWQAFFQKNQWVFGHNLLFQFVTNLANQGHVGGTTLSGKGAQRTDMLVHTEATTRFTVLVDIKRPDTEIVSSELYRNKVYPLGSDLTGGASQLQSYCRTWVTEGARQEENATMLQDERIYTYEPRGILVVGNLSQLDNQNKRATFELYRRNLRNPEVITYDELFERARFTVRLDGTEE